MPNTLFRKLPQVGQLLASPEFVALQDTYSRTILAAHLRAVLATLRAELTSDLHDDSSLERALGDLATRVTQRVQQALRPSLRPVINATGVILQTNLGRAPLSEAAIAKMADVARGYCNLEMDLSTGERSYRDQHVEQLILQVLAGRADLIGDPFSDHAAAVVNNCAAACFLALNSLAEGGEVLVSRGELIEIGGGFRIPDILRKSGAILREIGTTNRTRISDYEAAITPATRLIMRVHRSNFRIEGFTEQPTIEELRRLGARVSVPVFEDQGTGCLADLNELDIAGESSLTASIASGIALVACSGDKLLGGPQCGILVGSSPVIQRIRSNPLYRALRVDKLTYAALQATLAAYAAHAETTLPVIAMLQMPLATIRQRCAAMQQVFSANDLITEVIETRSVPGGGTAPGASLPSLGIALQHASMSESALSALLRNGDPPVIARSHQGRVVLDLRTVLPAQDAALAGAVQQALKSPGHLDQATEKA